MDYIIFDIEWNQPCYNYAKKQIGDVILLGEIIQLGAGLAQKLRGSIL